MSFKFDANDLLKGLAVVAAILFIIFVANFEKNYLVDTFFTDLTWVSYVGKVAAIKTLSIVGASLGIFTVVVNAVSNVLLGIEE